MTQIYIVDCTPLTDDSIIAQLLPSFDGNRQKKITSLKSPLKRAQTTAAGLLLRHCFGAQAQYHYGDHGKPYLADGQAYFSISHSGEWVALAVSDREIGVDLQVSSPIRPSVLRRCFTADEQIMIGKDAGVFTRLWTQKEAYAKYTGRGICAPLTSAINDLPPCWFMTRYNDLHITVYGDENAEILPIKIKDLL